MTRPRTIHLAALWTALTMVPVLALADVRICNRGEVDLKVLTLKTAGIQTFLSWDIEGWISVSPDDCRQVSYGDGYTHIVFAVEGSNGRKVVVQYEPENSTLPDSAKIKELCVSQANIKDGGWNNESKLPAQYLPPCREGFTAARTSATVLILGNARMWLNISPKAADGKSSKSGAPLKQPERTSRAAPAPPPKPPDAREFLASWYLSTRTVASLSEGQRRAASMQRIVGQKAFERAVAAARAGKLQPEGVLMRAELNREAYMDWLATKHDPGLYAIYLIKRSTGSDWDYAAALLRARVRRLGAKTVDDAVQRVFPGANAASGDCVGEPNTNLADCAAKLLGPQTLWNDALDVSAAEMDRAAMKTRMLEHLAGTPQYGAAAARYARITAVVPETILLAALHHQRKYGFGTLNGSRKDDTRWEPFLEEWQVLARFAIARDDRAFVVVAFMQRADGDALAKLEEAVEAYHDRVAEIGEERLLSAAKAVRPRLVSGLDLGDLLEESLAESMPPPPPEPVATPPYASSKAMASRISDVLAAGAPTAGPASANTAAFSSAAADVWRAMRLSAGVSPFGSGTSGNSAAMARRRAIHSWASGVNRFATGSSAPVAPLAGSFTVVVTEATELRFQENC